MAGQLIKRKKNTWLVRVYMGSDNGKRRYHNKTIHGNKKDAQAYLTKVLREKDTDTFVEPSKEPLKNYLDSWLETTAKARVREKTYKSNKQLIRLYMKPALGEVKLSQLTPEHIQSMYNQMQGNGLSSRTVKYTHSVLKSALQQAVKWGKFYRNPADLVNLPRHEKKEMRALSPQEASKFLKANENNRLKALFSPLGTSGMRPGEALGLKWSDINFEEGRVTVTRALSRSGKGWSLEEPKTVPSRRTIPIPKSTIKDLLKHKSKQAAEELEAENYAEHGFVFATKTGEPLCERNVVNRYFKPLLKQASLPDIRLYDLRHTCATLLLSAGENPKVVGERLGHASITMTLDTYSHVLPVCSRVQQINYK